MRRTAQWVSLALATSLVASCGALPRGAGLEREIIGKATTTEDPAVIAKADFVVAPVTRETVSAYATWPTVNQKSFSWISHQPAAPGRVIAAGDALSVTIWNTEENGLLTSPHQRFVTLPSMRVSPSGTVFLPYIGKLRVAGRSPESARELIENRYLSVTPSAQVQIELKEGQNSAVSLVGGVNKPGNYPMPDQSFTILNLLALGGGVHGSLTNPQVRLHRGGKIYGISVDKLYAAPSRDTTLRGGDKVIVSNDERVFLSLGAARREAVHPFSDDKMTALDALSIIGGLTDNRADPGGVLILRRYKNSDVSPNGSTGPAKQRVVFTIDMTSADGLFSAGEFLIQPNDLVYVSESPIVAASTIASITRDVLGVGNQLGL